MNEENLKKLLAELFAITIGNFSDDEIKEYEIILNKVRKVLEVTK